MEFKRNDRVVVKSMVGLVKNTFNDGSTKAVGVRVAVDGPHPKFWAVVPIEYVEKYSCNEKSLENDSETSRNV